MPYEWPKSLLYAAREVYVQKLLLRSKLAAYSLRLGCMAPEYFWAELERLRGKIVHEVCNRDPDETYDTLAWAGLWKYAETAKGCTEYKLGRWLQFIGTYQWLCHQITDLLKKEDPTEPYPWSWAEVIVLQGEGNYETSIGQRHERPVDWLQDPAGLNLSHWVAMVHSIPEIVENLYIQAAEVLYPRLTDLPAAQPPDHLHNWFSHLAPRRKRDGCQEWVEAYYDKDNKEEEGE